MAMNGSSTSFLSPSDVPSKSFNPDAPTLSPGKKSYRDRSRRKGQIWWSNAIFFISMHILAIYGATYLSPWRQLNWKTALLCFWSWQAPCFGITLGYHRLWSHRAYTATLPLRIFLAALGSMGFQGSIKWWVLRHRLHHRFTDSPIHDPYAATKGLFYSHCGWIFYKPSYPRMKLIERGDLEVDPVVRYQHKYFVPIALSMGFLLPWITAYVGWGDGMGGFVWGAVVARLMVWHATFCINSLAHWAGLQPYTEDVTARGNLILALITSGEGNHNFHHAFPQDFRNGPHQADWDPTKWIIWFLHEYTPLVPKIYRTPQSAIASARARVHTAHAERLYAIVPADEREKTKEELPMWSKEEVRNRNGQIATLEVESDSASELPKRWRTILLLIDGCLIDVGRFIDDHPGGKELILSHAVTPLPSSQHSSPLSSDSESSPSSTIIDSGYFSGSDGKSDEGKTEPIRLRDATAAFFGGMNNHTSAAKAKMRCLRVARLAENETNSSSS